MHIDPAPDPSPSRSGGVNRIHQLLHRALAAADRSDDAVADTIDRSDAAT